MLRIHRWGLVVVSGMLVAPCITAEPAQGQAPEKISLLIVEGPNSGHDWRVTTPAVRDLLVQTGRFQVDVLTAPTETAGPGDWDTFRPEFAKHKVVLLNYSGQSWPDEVKKTFEKYMEDGGGLVLFHGALLGHSEWENFNKMIGLTGQRNAAFGERIYYDDGGKQVRLAKGEGPTYPRPGHGPDHVFTVTVRDKEHPIMKGMPERWQHARDQLYHGLRGPARNMTILATAFSAKDKRGTGFHEPIVWTVSLGKSRVAVTTLGNDVTGITASGAAAVLCRAAEWTATGEVTISAPRDLPLADAPAGKTATTERAR